MKNWTLCLRGTFPPDSLKSTNWRLVQMLTPRFDDRLGESAVIGRPLLRREAIDTNQCNYFCRMSQTIVLLYFDNIALHLVETEV